MKKSEREKIEDLVMLLRSLKTEKAYHVNYSIDREMIEAQPGDKEYDPIWRNYKPGAWTITIEIT